MGRLVRIINGELAIAWRYVATPEYTLHVSDYAGGVAPPHGWVYFSDDVGHGDFAPVWKQPEGAHDAYAIGAIVLHNNVRWRSTIAANVWRPSVSGWAEAEVDIPAWIQPTGVHDAYSKEAIVRHNGQFWRSLLDGNVWEPSVAEWRRTALVAPGEPEPLQPWVQPTGAGDAYPLGARVTHNGQTWTSIASANVWEPGVYGWTAD
jgi:hypothetical protein